MAPRAAALAALLTAPRPSAALPSFRFRLPNGDRVLCPADATNCVEKEHSYQLDGLQCKSLGHLDCAGKSAPALNQFGHDFMTAGYLWTKELCEADSDGDGQSNGVEFGDPCCEWHEDDDISLAMLLWAPSHPGMASSTVQGLTDDMRLQQCNQVKAGRTVPMLNEFYQEGEEQRVQVFHIANHRVSTHRTTYVDFGWRFNDTECHAGDCYIAGFSPIVLQPKYVHHFTLYACKDSLPSHVADGALVDDMGYGCRLISGWVPGQRYMSRYPRDSALRIGDTAGWIIRSFYLGLHYTNYNHDDGVIDTSGFRIHYTTAHRPKMVDQVGVFTISISPTMYIPANHQRFYISGTCKIAGLQKPVQVYNNLFHAHVLGREMYTHRTRDGHREEVYQERNWYFDDQYDRSMAYANMNLSNGDIIQTTCVMDSTGPGARQTLRRCGPFHGPLKPLAQLCPYIGPECFPKGEERRRDGVCERVSDEIGVHCSGCFPAETDADEVEGVKVGLETYDEMCWGNIGILRDDEGNPYCKQDAVFWTGTLGRHDMPPTPAAAPRPGCGFERHVSGGSLYVEYHPPERVLTRCGGGLGEGCTRCTKTHCAPCFPADARECCKTLREVALNGCLCDDVFNRGQGYISPERMQQLGDYAITGCGVDPELVCKLAATNPPTAHVDAASAEVARGEGDGGGDGLDRVAVGVGLGAGVGVTLAVIGGAYFFVKRSRDTQRAHLLKSSNAGETISVAEKSCTSEKYAQERRKTVDMACGSGLVDSGLGATPAGDVQKEEEMTRTA